ncbi:MAG: hypothetical protein JSS21_10625 [Proteobacteria bacterium]|nr:hypothetical protein [Pseudomonadota bacterium]
MPELPLDPAENAPAAVRRSIRWDALAAIIAALVGLLALIVAGYTAYIQRQQVRAQVWPYLMWANSDNSSEYMWINKGVGPAIVKSAQVLIGGRPQRDWDEVLRTLQTGELKIGQSSFNHGVVSAGETIEWLKFKDQSDFRTFRTAAERMQLKFKVCYCSTLGDCWVDDTTRGIRGNNTRFAVDRCPAVPESGQFQD